MALKLQSLITAVLMSLILAIAVLPATAAAQSEPQRKEATQDNDLLAAIVQRYRDMVDAISRAMKNDSDSREIVSKTRMDNAVGQALRTNPDLLKAPAPQPKRYVPPAYKPPTSTPQSSIGSARLTWNIPTRRENGELLRISDIASYEIYMTAESTGASRTIRVSDASKTQFTLVPLPADTYHFSMATIDKQGTYSGLSQVVSKTVR